MDVHLCDGTGKNVIFMARNQLGMISEKFAISYLFQIFWMAVMGREGFPILIKGVQNFGQKIGVLFQNWVLVEFTFFDEKFI